MHTKVSAFLTVLSLFLCAYTVSAQVDATGASLKWTITDQNGALIIAANISATSVDRGLVRYDQTSSGANFQISLLPPGVYKVELDAQGFKKVLNENVQ